MLSLFNHVITSWPSFKESHLANGKEKTLLKSPYVTDSSTSDLSNSQIPNKSTQKIDKTVDSHNLPPKAVYVEPILTKIDQKAYNPFVPNKPDNSILHSDQGLDELDNGSFLIDKIDIEKHPYKPIPRVASDQLASQAHQKSVIKTTINNSAPELFLKIEASKKGKEHKMEDNLKQTNTDPYGFSSKPINFEKSIEKLKESDNELKTENENPIRTVALSRHKSKFLTLANRRRSLLNFRPRKLGNIIKLAKKEPNNNELILGKSANSPAFSEQRRLSSTVRGVIMMAESVSTEIEPLELEKEGSFSETISQPQTILAQKSKPIGLSDRTEHHVMQIAGIVGQSDTISNLAKAGSLTQTHFTSKKGDLMSHLNLNQNPFTSLAATSSKAGSKSGHMMRQKSSHSVLLKPLSSLA